MVRSTQEVSGFERQTGQVGEHDRLCRLRPLLSLLSPPPDATSVPSQHSLSHPTPPAHDLDWASGVLSVMGPCPLLARNGRLGAPGGHARCQDVLLPELPHRTLQICQRCKRVGPTCPMHTCWTRTLSGITVSSARGPSPSSGWDVTGGEGPREPGAVARRSLSSRE